MLIQLLSKIAGQRQTLIAEMTCGLINYLHQCSKIQVLFAPLVSYFLRKERRKVLQVTVVFHQRGCKILRSVSWAIGFINLKQPYQLVSVETAGFNYLGYMNLLHPLQPFLGN